LTHVSFEVADEAIRAPGNAFVDIEVRYFTLTTTRKAVGCGSLAIKAVIVTRQALLLVLIVVATVVAL